MQNTPQTHSFYFNEHYNNRGRANRTSVFEHAQNAQIQIILLMRKVSSGRFLATHILQYPIILLADSEGPDQTAHPRSLIWAFAVRICLKTHFRMARPIYMTS